MDQQIVCDTVEAHAQAIVDPIDVGHVGGRSDRGAASAAAVSTVITDQTADLAVVSETEATGCSVEMRR